MNLKNVLKKIPCALWAHALLKNTIASFSYVADFLNFKRKTIAVGQRFSIALRDLYPCISDKTATTAFDRHYIYHPAWAARVLAQTRPEWHVDISSSLSFCTLVSAFIPVRFYDYRPAELRLSHLTSTPADICALPFPDASVHSISCMHVVEHIGLGRYGDPIDPSGDLKAIAELKRVLAPGGNLLFVVPVGRPRIMFNAHRIYSYGQIIDYFSELMLIEFALIPDCPADGGLISNASKEQADSQSYACGCFWFTR
jgi:SAM-dependent methyltransferase